MEQKKKFSSSAELTRFLRQKGQDIHVSLEVAEKLLNGEINIYLPKSDLILIDWIFDKLQTEKSWRTNKDAWKFLATLWKKLRPELADRVYASHKFGYILCETFNAIKTLSRSPPALIAELLENVSNCVSVIDKAIFENNVLSSFFEMCSWILGSHPDLQKADGLAKLAEIFSKSVSHRSGISKNSYIVLLGDSNVLQAVSALAQSVFLSHCNSLPQGSQFFSEQDIQQLLKTSELAIVNIFELVISNFSRPVWEIVFTKFIGQCPSAAPKLLETIVQHKLSLKDDILKSLISDDSEILKCLMKLNADLIFSDQSPVDALKIPPQNVDQSYSDLTLSYHASARKLDTFLSAWVSFPSNSAWKSDASISQLIKYLSRLSPYQHRQYVEKFEFDEEVIFLLVECSSLYTNTLLVAPLLTRIAIETGNWHLKFKILSLPREIADACGKDILKAVNLNTKDCETKYWMIQCSFRICELMPASKFHDIMENMVLPNAQDFLESIADRWFVLLGQICEKSTFEKLAQEFTNNDTAFTWLTRLCDNWLFFEQPIFFNEVLKILIQMTGTNPGCEKVLPIINKIPLIAFPKAARLKLLDNLVENVQELSLLRLQEISRQLTIYSSQAKIENDASKLHRLFIKSMSSKQTAFYGKQMVLAILERKAANDDKLFPEYISFLKKKSKRNYGTNEKGYFELTCLLSAYDDEAATDLGIYFSNLEKFNIDAGSIEFIMEISPEVLERYKGDLAASFACEKSALFFPVFCKFCTSLEGILSLMAIYCHIEDHDLGIGSNLRVVLNNTSPEIFECSFAQVIAGVGSSAPYESLYRLCYLFATVSNDENQNLVARDFTKLFCTVLKNMRDSRKLVSSQLFWIMKSADHLLKHKSWAVSQFLLETILALVDALVKNVEKCTSDLFVVCCDSVSSIILFHRHRLNGRYHLIMLVFRSMLKYLSNNTCSSEDMRNFSRLLGSLCEPPVKAVRERGGEHNLSSAAALAKRQLAKYLPNLFLEYVSVCLTPGLSSECKTELRSGVYAMMRVLDPDGLRRASGLMDYSSRAYLRPLYKEYLNNGKWQATSS